MLTTKVHEGGDPEQAAMTIATPDDRDVRIDMPTLIGAVLSRWLRVLVITIVLLALTFIALMFVPRLYESSATVLVAQRENAFTRAVGEQASSSGISADALMSSQIELIKSRDTLLSVIDSENLRAVPEFADAGFSPVSFVMRLLGRTADARNVDQQVLANLYDRLTVIRERDSALISIFVRAEDPQLAARLANAIANAHVRRRAELSLSDTAEASVWLEQEITKLRTRVEEAESAVAQYRIRNDLFTGSNQTSLPDQQLSTIADQITAAQERRNAAASRAAVIRGMLNSGQGVDGLADLRDTATVQQLAQNKADLQRELAQRSATLLDNHPTMRALRAQITEVDGQIAAEARRVAASLEAEARVEGEIEASLRDDLARVKITASNATQNSVALDALEREAKAQRDLLEGYLLRYRDALSRTESSSTLPDVRVVTIAAPAVTPASPKTTLTLGAVAFVALMLQVGGILFGELMSGRALVARGAAPMDTASLRPLPGAAPPPEPLDADLEPEPHSDERDSPQAEERHEAAFAQVQPRAEVRNDASEPAAAAAAAEIAEAIEPAETVEPAATPVPATTDAAPRDFRRVAPAAFLRDNPAPAASPEPAGSPRPIRAQVNKPSRTAPADPDLAFHNLSADVAIGRVRVLVLAGIESYQHCQEVSDRLAADALQRGLSVVCVDAGSGHLSDAPGLTDLAAETASFGDVVHKIHEGLAEVPWGTRRTLERRSLKPLTLVEALSDLYEVVIVVSGRLSLASSLPAFSGLDCRLVLVGPDSDDKVPVEAAIEEAAALGFHITQVVAPPMRAEVA
jgi:succinoglycan biosynthesis transport protein ExoP